MAPIGIVATLSQTHGEYWLAGAVSATYAFINAILSPQLSRFIDRFGQTKVAVPTTTLAAIAFAVLMVAANRHWPIWILFAAAVVAALMPNMPAMVRARWTEIFRDRPELNTAFAFESAGDELVYILGASISVGLSVALFPEAGVVASTALLAAGTAAFLAQRSTEPPVGSATTAAGWAIRLRSVQIITLALIAVGAMFATTEVVVVALTRAFGQPDAATLVIGVYALGSFAVGLILGAFSPQMRLERQLLLTVGVIAATSLPLLSANGVASLGLAVFVSGIAIAPTFISAFGLIERRVPPSMLTEGVTWVTTGIGIGMALGSAAAGWVVDSFGPDKGFWVSVAAGAIAFLTVLFGQKTLEARDDTGEPAGVAAPTAD
jgi:MFS family permease